MVLAWHCVTISLDASHDAMSRIIDEEPDTMNWVGARWACKFMRRIHGRTWTYICPGRREHLQREGDPLQQR